jgi:hypothetical protein
MQVEENHIPRRRGAGVDVVAVAHGMSDANDEARCLFSSMRGGVLHRSFRRPSRKQGAGEDGLAEARA